MGILLTGESRMRGPRPYRTRIIPRSPGRVKTAALAQVPRRARTRRSRAFGAISRDLDAFMPRAGYPEGMIVWRQEQV